MFGVQPKEDLTMSLVEQTLVLETVEILPQVVAETFMTGCYDEQFWARAKYKCPHCLKIHVVLHDGKFIAGRGRDLPTEFVGVCKLTQKRLLIKAWNPSDFREAAKKVAAAVGQVGKKLRPRKSPKKDSPHE
jgi:hypothetical protein